VRIKPEQQLKTLWYLTWLIIFFSGIVFWILMIFFVNKLAFGICLAVWCAIFISIAFWIPKAYQAVEYFIEKDSLKMQAGVVWKKNITIPYSKITNIDITSGPMQRKFGIGTVHVQTAGYGGQQGQKPELKINGIKETIKIRDTIIQQISSQRKSFGVNITPAEDNELPKGNSPENQAMILKDILSELKNINKKLQKF
jgi:membrane protein YdbS with pleckstrin-like domain